MVLEAQSVSVSLGGRTIVDRVDVTVAGGDLLAIVGPNGSGKTTLLRALSGDLGYSGTISLNGADLSALKAWQAADMRAVLPQATALSFPFTVREVVRLGLMGGRSGVPRSEEARLPDRALARVDLDGFAGRFYQELSGGEQQRVQLARVLCQVWSPVLDGRPRLLLLDEPVSSLDVKHQLLIMSVARDFARAGGAVIAVLHDLNLTAMFAHKVLVMSNGRVFAAGRPAEVMTDAVIETVFDCRLRVGHAPATGTPFVLPQSYDAA